MSDDLVFNAGVIFYGVDLINPLKQCRGDHLVCTHVHVHTRPCAHQGRCGAVPSELGPGQEAGAPPGGRGGRGRCRDGRLSGLGLRADWRGRGSSSRHASPPPAALAEHQTSGERVRISGKGLGRKESRSPRSERPWRKAEGSHTAGRGLRGPCRLSQGKRPGPVPGEVPVRDGAGGSPVSWWGPVPPEASGLLWLRCQ